jgi:hypothetical protein
MAYPVFNGISDDLGEAVVGKLLTPSNHLAGPGISPQFHWDIPHQVNMQGIQYGFQTN